MKLTACLLALILAAGTLSACSGGSAPGVGAAGQPSSSDVNPITGSRGGSGGNANH